MGKSRATKPTPAQTVLITQAGLIASWFYVIHEDEKVLRLVSRASGKTRKIEKAPAGKQRGYSK